jgi:hypothetical protein
MDQCSPPLRGTTSHQPYDLLAADQGHDLALDLEGLATAVLTQPAARTPPCRISGTTMQSH